jgi:putative endonuclease
MIKGGYVYILTNKNNRVLYTGVTSSLLRRIPEHKTKLHPESFSAKYNLQNLVYYEWHNTIVEAIAKEKYFKGKSRQFKIDSIDKLNPDWLDLFEQRIKLKLI